MHRTEICIARAREKTVQPEKVRSGYRTKTRTSSLEKLTP
jgi:hypothetical protein